MHTLRLIHRWIGIAVALPVILVGLSGALLLGRDAYYRARWPEVATAVRPDLERQAAVLTTIERRFASAGVRTVKFPRTGANAFHAYLADGTEALVNPASGETIARWGKTDDPAAFLFDLHANLLIAAKGRTLNGYLALVLLFFALSGVILWLPRRSTTFRLRYALLRGTSASEMLRGHAALGVCLALPLIVFAATGAGLVFYEPLGRLLSGALDPTTPVNPSAVVPRQPLTRAGWLQVLTSVQAALPEAGPKMYSPGPATNPVLTFRKRLPGEWHPNGRSYVLVDPYSGEVLQAIDARQQGPGTRIMYAMYPVHAATVGGPLWWGIAVLTGAGLGWLSVGAIWAYTGRTLRVRRSVRRAEGATAGRISRYASRS